eukprot:SAG11_NODE_23782_length_383_cov_0.732394_1_plen_40_part_10
MLADCDFVVMATPWTPETDQSRGDEDDLRLHQRRAREMRR